MGRAKDWMIQQWERGYDEADGDICRECVSDDALADWITANVSATECTYCGATAEVPIAASFDDFVGFVLDGISFDWNNPDDEGIMYVSAEGGYMAPISDTWEVLADYEISENSAVVDDLAGSINTDAWVTREFYHGDDSQRLVWGWDSFKEFTKGHSRYFFLQPEAEEEDDDELTPAEMLGSIAGMIKSDLGAYNLIKRLASGTDLIRIRIDGATHNLATEIGAPTPEFATQSNRMSPAGIPMFYGAFDFRTAHAETFDPLVHAGQVMSVGTFRPLRELNVLDLALLPAIPSVFDADRRGLIHTLRFLHSFARDISKPIARDGREHIEYVPTQIVTEYFRRVFRTEDGLALDGIIYRSSREQGGRAFVLFCENRQCVDEVSKSDRGEMLQLVNVTHQACGTP
jgi:hypothetical protein